MHIHAAAQTQCVATTRDVKDEMYHTRKDRNDDTRLPQKSRVARSILKANWMRDRIPSRIIETSIHNIATVVKGDKIVTLEALRAPITAMSEYCVHKRNFLKRDHME